MKYQFIVNDGLPPKKDGAQSMWGKPAEAKRLVKLRKAAIEALQGNPPLSSNIGLNIKIYVGKANTKYTGDLDNYITGILDGLMKADERAKLDPIWLNPGLENIHPSKTIAIIDDSQVVYLEATKIMDDSPKQWYEIIVEGEQ